MLYISTRMDNDIYTAHRTLVGDRAPNGGCYVPFSLPVYSESEIAALKDKQFNEVLAEVLNLFFSARLTGLDIDFAVGKNPCVVHPMNHRIAVAELWHNPGRNYSYLAKKLYTKLCDHDDCSANATDWVKIAIDIAIFFAVYAASVRDGVINIGQQFDVAADTEHFSTICAAWYAKKMGLPVGMIICTEKDNGIVWDLIQRGTFSALQVSDDITGAVERLLLGTLGADAVLKFVSCVVNRRTFSIIEEDLAVLNEGLFCSVAGNDRATTVINSVFRSNSYVIDHEAALCYGGLQDYRAKSGESRLTVLFGKHAPVENVG